MPGRGSKSVGLGNYYEPTEQERKVYNKYFDKQGELQQPLDTFEERKEIVTALLVPGCSEKLKKIVGRAIQSDDTPEFPLTLTKDMPVYSLSEAFYVLNCRDMIFDEISELELEEKERTKKYKELEKEYRKCREFVTDFFSVPEEEQETKRQKLSFN
jgi:hypothetical protein